MEKLLTLFNFLIISYGFGYTFTRFWKSLNLEVITLRIAVGLAAFGIVGVILNLLHIPLDWRVFLGLALIMPIIDVIRQPKLNVESLIREEWWLLVLFAINLFIYLKGSFGYPWLEDSDPWFHAAGSHYVAYMKNLNVTYDLTGPFSYINPYPPAYDVILGILHQTDRSIYYVMNFFNSLIVSLSYLFFFYFVKEWTNAKKALIATFFLTCIPCYLTHFIWAHNLAIALFFPAFYGTLKIIKDKKWILPTAILYAGIALSTPTQAIKFVLMWMIVFVAIVIWQRKQAMAVFCAALWGTLLSLLWYFPVGWEMLQQKHYVPKTENLFGGEGGHPTRAYDLSILLFPDAPNYVANPVGVGMVLMILLVIGLWFVFAQWKTKSPEHRIYAVVLLAWLVITFIGSNTSTFGLPFGLFPYRYWLLLAIPICMLAAEGVGDRKIVLVMVMILVVITSGIYKYQNNTNLWRWGPLWNENEKDGYVWLRQNFPAGTKIFAYVDNYFVIGQDMHVDFWSENYQETFKDAFSFSPEKLHQKLKANQFQYLIIGARGIRTYGIPAAQQKIRDLMVSGLFEMERNQKNTFFVLKVL